MLTTSLLLGLSSHLSGTDARFKMIDKPAGIMVDVEDSTSSITAELNKMHVKEDPKISESKKYFSVKSHHTMPKQYCDRMTTDDMDKYIHTIKHNRHLNSFINPLVKNAGGNPATWDITIGELRNILELQQLQSDEKMETVKLEDLIQNSIDLEGSATSDNTKVAWNKGEGYALEGPVWAATLGELKSGSKTGIKASKSTYPKAIILPAEVSVKEEGEIEIEIVSVKKEGEIETEKKNFKRFSHVVDEWKIYTNLYNEKVIEELDGLKLKLPEYIDDYKAYNGVKIQNDIGKQTAERKKLAREFDRIEKLEKRIAYFQQVRQTINNRGLLSPRGTRGTIYWPVKDIMDVHNSMDGYLQTLTPENIDSLSTTTPTLTTTTSSSNVNSNGVNIFFENLDINDLMDKLNDLKGNQNDNFNNEKFAVGAALREDEPSGAIREGGVAMEEGMAQGTDLNLNYFAYYRMDIYQHLVWDLLGNLVLNENVNNKPRNEEDLKKGNWDYSRRYAMIGVAMPDMRRYDNTPVDKVLGKALMDQLAAILPKSELVKGKVGGKECVVCGRDDTSEVDRKLEAFIKDVEEVLLTKSEKIQKEFSPQWATYFRRYVKDASRFGYSEGAPNASTDFLKHMFEFAVYQPVKPSDPDKSNDKALSIQQKQELETSDSHYDNTLSYLENILTIKFRAELGTALLYGYTTYITVPLGGGVFGIPTSIVANMMAKVVKQMGGNGLKNFVVTELGNRDKLKIFKDTFREKYGYYYGSENVKEIGNIDKTHKSTMENLEK